MQAGQGSDRQFRHHNQSNMRGSGEQSLHGDSSHGRPWVAPCSDGLVTGAARGGKVVRLCVVHPVLVRREPQQFAVLAISPLCLATHQEPLTRIQREQRHVAIGPGERG